MYRLKALNNDNYEDEALTEGVDGEWRGLNTEGSFLILGKKDPGYDSIQLCCFPRGR